MKIIKNTDEKHEISCHVRHCPICQEYMEKWIGVYKVGDMCINCAQNMARIISENILKYNNGGRISLLDIMHHGNPEDAYNSMYWIEERFPEFYPDMGDQYYISEKRRLREEAEYEAEHGESDEKPNIITHCEICQKIVNNWIDIYPEISALTGTLCIDCAQYIMRTMYEDIIEYHNGVRVSLADIMFYGNQNVDQMIAEEKIIEEAITKYRASNNLSDFDDEIL